jgi:predicted membrane-bound mannosyltransferase
MLNRGVLITSVFLGFSFRILFSLVMFISAGEVETPWLSFTLLVIMSVMLARGLYRLYRSMVFVYALGRIDS